MTSSWTCATADADLRVRVTSGNKKRTLTMREAIVDEQDGGTFLAEMTDGEFGLDQRLLCGGLRTFMHKRSARRLRPP